MSVTFMYDYVKKTKAIRTLTPCSRVLEKLTVTQLVKKLPAFYGTRMSITVFITARHWSLSWVRWIQSIPSNLISLRSILISCIYSQVFQVVSSLNVFWPKYCIIFPICAACSAHLILLDLITIIIIFVDEYKLKNPHSIVFSSLLLLPPS
jgi:hypothetical protein